MVDTLVKYHHLGPVLRVETHFRMGKTSEKRRFDYERPATKMPIYRNITATQCPDGCGSNRLGQVHEAMGFCYHIGLIRRTGFLGLFRGAKG